MIVVTGASGQLGGAIIESLLRTLPAEQIAASAQEPIKLSNLADRGVAVRAGDFASPDQLATAFEGATQVLIVSANRLGPEAETLHRNAIEAARAAAARRVLYTSHMGARAASPFLPAVNHATSEAIMAESRKPFTALRHGFYAESALHMLGPWLQDGEIRVPEDGPVSWTARDDLAEADAAILIDEGRLDGVTPPLTALDAITMADIAEIASELTGREIKRVTLTDDDWRDAKIASGVPPEMAELLLGSWRAMRRGDFAAVDPTLETLLGRRPLTMRDVLAKTLAPSS